MSHTHVLHAEIPAGCESFFSLESPDRKSSWSLVFEDDGDSGYAYACVTHGHGPGSARIVDSKLVYVVDRDVEREAPVRVELVWDEAGKRAGVLVDARVAAAFDFASCSAWSRTCFPPCDDGWNELPQNVCAEVERWFAEIRASAR